jgi:hypothetical protein
MPHPCLRWWPSGPGLTAARSAASSQVWSLIGFAGFDQPWMQRRAVGGPLHCKLVPWPRLRVLQAESAAGERLALLAHAWSGGLQTGAWVPGCRARAGSMAGARVRRRRPGRGGTHRLDVPPLLIQHEQGGVGARAERRVHHCCQREQHAQRQGAACRRCRGGAGLAALDPKYNPKAQRWHCASAQQEWAVPCPVPRRQVPGPQGAAAHPRPQSSAGPARCTHSPWARSAWPQQERHDGSREARGVQAAGFIGGFIGGFIRGFRVFSLKPLTPQHKILTLSKLCRGGTPETPTPLKLVKALSPPKGHTPGGR